MNTDDDLIDFDNFFDGIDDGLGGVEPNYIDRHIARIPQNGDDSRWRLADYLDMFEHLAPDGSLTDEQRQAVDNFAIGWQSHRSESDKSLDQLQPLE